MGKKKKRQAMQRSNVGSSFAGPEDVEQGKDDKDTDTEEDTAPIFFFVSRFEGERRRRTYSISSSFRKRKHLDELLLQMDGSFHSPELHAARLASSNTSHTITQEEFKKKHKENELKTGEQEADKDRMMTENRARLDAERPCKVSLGRNRSTSKSHQENEIKDEDSKIGSRRKRGRSGRNWQ